jgi:predicted outer membrane repeat protein
MFDNNSSGLAGGAVFVNNINGTYGFYADYTNFTYNISQSGGAIYLIGTKDNSNGLSISYVSFNGNSANRGGSLYLDTPDGQITIDDSRFLYERASDLGGSIYAETDHTLLLRDTYMADNYAVNSGGALYFNGLSSTASKLEVYDTTPPLSSGLLDSTFESNYALKGDGGAFYVTQAGMIHIHGTNNKTTTYAVFRSNIAYGLGDSAPKGGAIYFNGIAEGIGDVLIEDYVSIYNNEVGYSSQFGYGGALYMENAGNFTADFDISFANNGGD